MFDCANQVASISGNIHIQKLAFIYELEGQRKGIKAAHYRFFRYTMGPFSKDLANDVGFLKELEFVTKWSNEVTHRGRFLLEYLGPHLNKARTATTALQILRKVCKEYAKFSGWDLMNQVYKMNVPVISYGNKRLKVKEIGSFIDILDPIRDDKLRDIEPLPEDTISDLKEEFAIQASRLDPQNASVRASVLRTLHRAL